MSKTRMTKNEKRRLLLKKQARRKSISRKALVIAIVLSLLMSGMVMILVNALDGRGYEDISPEIFNGTNTYSVPTEGIPRGTWFKYTRDGKKYVYQTQYDLVSGDILTLQDNDTIDIYHDPTVGAYNLLDYADLKSSNPYTFELKQGTATYNNDGIVIGYTDNILKAGQRYYYTPDNTNYYSFTPTEDIGYEWIETREQGVYTQKTLGDLTITLDPNASDTEHQFSVVGNKYTRKVIYELDDSLDSNEVYLITAVHNGTEYMFRYGDSKYFNEGSYDNYEITSFSLRPDCPSWENAHGFLYLDDRGEYVYSHTYKTVTQNPGPVDSVPVVETRIATSPTEDNQIFYDFNPSVSGALSDKMIPTSHSYYYDGDDGSLSKDIYVYSELSTYRINVPQGLIAWLVTEGSGNYLMGYDGNGSSGEQNNTTTNNSHKGYYTSGKAFGTIYTLNNNYAENLLMHEACTYGLINHNYGNMWDYDSSTHRLKNKNASIGSFGFSNILNFNPSDGFTIKHQNELESYTLIYKMKDVYTHEDIEQHRSITAETKGHTQVDATELEDVTVTLSHSGTYAQSNREFVVTFTLTDENGNPVPGKWSTDDLEFTNGVYSTTMKNGDSIPFTNIPKGYSLNVSVTLPDGSGDENALYYSATINGQAGTENDVVIDDDKQIPIVITDTRKKAHISLTYTGDNISNPNQTFPVTLKLTKDDTDETPVSGTFVGTDASGYTFDNGECVVSPMANNQSFDLYVPKGYKLTTTVTLPAENTEYYTSSVDETAGTTATTVISADDNIPIEITSVKELVTITNQTEGNSEQDNYADLTKKFPLKLTLYNADGQTPMSGDFIGSDGTTVYHFGEDGVCSNTIELADDESISLYLPKNMVLKVEDAENPLQYTTSYTDPVTPDSENPLNTSISGNDINIVVTHTRNWLPPVTLFGSSNDNHYSFIIRMVLVITVAAGIIYLVFLKRKLRIQ